MGTLKRRALFLDRDGVLVVDRHYLKDPSQIELLPDVVSGLKAAQQNNFFLVVVTNQSGIGRGLITQQEYSAVATKLDDIFRSEGISFETYFSPYFAEAQEPRYLMNADWRKPAPGMFKKAALDHNIDLSESWMIGDSFTDLQAALNAGLKKAFLLHSPKFKIEQEKWQTWQKAQNEVMSTECIEVPNWLELKKIIQRS